MSQSLFELPIPDVVPVKIDRSNVLLSKFRGCKIVQCGGTFRMHGDGIAVTLDPLDALWVLDNLSLQVFESPIMRRVCVWKRKDADDEAETNG